MSAIFSSTLLTLGRSLEYTPRSALMDRLLTHSPTCPEPTKHSPHPDITWESFWNKFKRSKPNKAGGGGTSQTTTLCTSPPPPIQQFVWRVCNHYLHQLLPEKWLEANIILLLKKGDVMNPVNYRPIALLNSVYKKILTHTNRELLAAAIEHSIIHPTQFGGLPNRRCQDHIFNLLSNFRESDGGYSLYIDLNKAFNSVPRPNPFHGAGLPELPHTPCKPHSILVPRPPRLPDGVGAHSLLPPTNQGSSAGMPHVTHHFLPLLERTPFRLAVSRNCTPLPARIRPRLC